MHRKCVSDASSGGNIDYADNVVIVGNLDL